VKSATTGPAATPRRRYRTVGLAAIGALAVATHVWLGGAALASWRWTSVAADLILVAVIGKLAVLTVVAVRHRAPHRAGARNLHKGRRRDPVKNEPMTRSEARVPTPRAERYAKQLCGHAAWKARRAEWTPPHGVIDFPDDMGTCRITAEPGHLRLALEADGAANLARMQQIVGDNIERFAGRDGLTVEWTQR
jgi:hypothetical protein